MEGWTTTDLKNDITKTRLSIPEVPMAVPNSMPCESQGIIKKAMGCLPAMEYYSIMNLLSEEKRLLLEKSLWLLQKSAYDFKINYTYEILMPKEIDDMQRIM